jgi:hypothetical protein
MIKKTRPLIVNKYDKDILDSEGFDHHPELQMLPFSMKEVRYEVYEVISKAAEKGTEIGSRGNFFFVGLGGGTGTGVISPLAEEFGKGSRGYFTLGLLGGKDDNEYLGSQQPWFRRCFNILLALNDLIATADLDGIILVDNEVLMARLEKRGKFKKHEAVSSDRKNFNKFLDEEFGMDWVANAEIARSKFESDGNRIYHIYDANENFAELNIDNKRQSAILKISDGRIYNLKVEEWFLFSWDNVPQKVDGRLLSFLREDLDLKWAENAKISKEDGNTIHISKGGDSAEITICDDGKKATIKVNDDTTLDLKVKNEDGKQNIYAGKIHGMAYAEKIDEELTKMIYPAFGITACEESGSDVDWTQLKHHMGLETQEQRSPIFVPCYASGKVNANTKDLINEALDKGMLAKCDYKKADKIIGYVRNIENEDAIKRILSEKFKTERQEIKIIKRAADRTDVLTGVSAKIIVFESKTSREEEEESRENEVLLLLRNCDVKNTLYNRLKVAQGFVDLLDAFKDLINEEKNQSSLSTEEIAREIIKNLIKGKNGELGEIVEKILEEIPTDGIEPEYLFSWDLINQKDNEEAKNKLRWSLRNVYNIDWAKDLKINLEGNKILCKPAAGGGSEITIEKGAEGTASLKSGGKTYDLTISVDDGEQKVYESENRAAEKILEEAKSFLLPMDIGPQKRDGTYTDMVKIVANLKVIVKDAINNLDNGIMPIFTKPIFNITSASISDNEVNLTSMFAMGEDTYSTYRDALGDKNVERRFDDFKREMVEDGAYVADSGYAGGYTLTEVGRGALEGLEEELNEVPTAIVEPFNLLNVIGTKKFLEVAKRKNISFLKLLVLSHVYIKNKTIGAPPIVG